MRTSSFLSSLNLATLLIVLAVAAVGFGLFLRHRRNRHPLQGHAERNVAADLDAGRPAPDHHPRV
jgi:hypothetical protein